ncbi:C40 family peptidase [Actinoplanes sp. NPDC051859]|uniref:C40 family peptidase n=1 Tax=Actinoplanes sp. NPDC051859 TaxID=3363909 RepID=UPI00379114F1
MCRASEFTRASRADRGAALSTSPLRLAACAGALTILLLPTPVQSAPTKRLQAPPITADELQSRLVPRKIPQLTTEKAVAPRKKKILTARKLAQRHARARIKVVKFARAQRGDWYSYGASGPNSWDCSGLTAGTYRVVGIRLPHSSAAQARRGKRVSSGTARVGDLVAMRGHVGILVGRWRMVDAPGSGRRVTERFIYKSSSLQFRRLIG